MTKYDFGLARLWKARPIDNTGGRFLAVAGVSGAEFAVGSVDAGSNRKDFLIEKYDDKGTRLWSKVSGGTGDDELTAVVMVGSKVYAIGYTTSQGSGGQDIVTLEIDPESGNVLSTTLFGGAQDDVATGVATDGAALYIVGSTRSFGATPSGPNQGIVLTYRPRP